MNIFIKLTASILLLTSILSFSCYSAAISVVIPAPLDGHSVRNPFVEQLLALIFEQQNKQVTINYSQSRLTQARALKLLSEGEIVDLNWSVTSDEREQQLLPVRIPIYRGLIGWRVLLIRNDRQEKFDRVTNIEQLRRLVAVQKFDWPDAQIYRDNGMQVESNMSLPLMLKAVKQGIADYFPRSVLEAHKEIGTHANKQLKIENNLLLKYPSACFFFVNKNNAELANIIEQGFKEILANGRYQQLFEQHFGAVLTDLKLTQRKVIALQNPNFPKINDELPSHYWFSFEN